MNVRTKIQQITRNSPRPSYVCFALSNSSSIPGNIEILFIDFDSLKSIIDVMAFKMTVRDSFDSNFSKIGTFPSKSFSLISSQ